jgi:hypothetical protein
MREMVKPEKGETWTNRQSGEDVTVLGYQKFNSVRITAYTTADGEFKMDYNRFFLGNHKKKAVAPLVKPKMIKYEPKPAVDLPEPKVKPKDMVNHPSHYTSGKIECIDALESAVTDLTGIEAVCTANAIKYLWRWKHKNGKQDLQKAVWYINKLMEKLS